MQTYTTRTEAVAREITAAIEACGESIESYDIDAIADAVIGDYEDGYACIVDPDAFWAVVAEHAL